MRWRLIGALGLPGLAMGVASVAGWTEGREGPLWFGVGMVAALAIAWRAPGRPFLNGLAAGALAGAVAPVVEALLFRAYLLHNPGFAARLADLPPGASPRLLVLESAAAIAPGVGLLVGILAWIAARATGRRALDWDG